MKKDSAPSTKLHIEMVGDIGTMFIARLAKRLREHDASKLQEPERTLLDGSPNYGEYGTGTPSQPVGRDVLTLQEFLRHHYAHNDHHPEHHPNGVDDMDLFMIIEMFVDWAASTLRSKNGSLYRSIQYNQSRFGVSPQLTRIFMNTALQFEEALERLKELYPEGEDNSTQSHGKAGG